MLDIWCCTTQANMANLGLFILLCLQGFATTRGILGGRPAAKGQFPWAVALFYRGRLICTASIIGKTSVLTSALCVVDKNNQPRETSQFHGIANVDRTASEVRLDFASLSVNPDYANLDNDIAIFRTNQSIPFSKSVDKVALAAMNTAKSAYRNATAMGWGSTSPELVIPMNPIILRYAAVRLRETCPMLFNGTNESPDDKICSRDFNSVCSGDAGGPLVHLSASQRPTQIGINSYFVSINSCRFLTPTAAFTRVSDFSDFIRDATDGDDVEFV